MLFLLFSAFFVVLFYDNIRTKIFISLQKKSYENSQEQKNISEEKINNLIQNTEDERLFENYFLKNSLNKISEKNEEIDNSTSSLMDIVKSEKKPIENFEAQILKVGSKTINIKNEKLGYNNIEIKIDKHTDFYKRTKKDPKIFAQELEEYNNQKKEPFVFPPFPYSLGKALFSEMKVGQNVYLTIREDYSNLIAIRIELIF